MNVVPIQKWVWRILQMRGGGGGGGRALSIAAQRQIFAGPGLSMSCVCTHISIRNGEVP